MAHTKSILIIEDNDIVRRYYADHLRLVCRDHLIYEAATGKTGLDLCQWQTIDCVILDLSLPDMSGFQVLAKLVPVPSQPRLPVIILTSIARQNILDVAKDKGAFAALQKDLTTGDELADVALKAMTAIALNGEKAAAALSARSVSA